MFSLFRLLFSRNYWRTLFHGETWRRTGVSLRRAHKDARARKQLRQMLLLLATPFLCILYLGWIVGSGAGLIGAVLALVVMGGVALYRSRRPVENDGPLTLSLTEYKDASPAPPPEPSADLQREFAEMALVLAVLIERASSERFVRTKVLPEGMEVLTRQKHMEVLREYALLDRMGDRERDLMLLPDGHWEPEWIDRVLMEFEPLRLLRWVLRVDKFLPTVGGTMVADFRLAGSLVKEPAVLFRMDGLMSIENLRIGITAAEQYFYRCWGEGLARGLYQAQEEDDEHREARQMAERLRRNEGEDLLLGAVIVGKAADAEVRLGTTLSLRRARVLIWVRDRMYGKVAASERVQVLPDNAL